MARSVSLQYQAEIEKKIIDQINEYMDAKNIVGNLFNGETLADNVVQKIIFQHFDKIAEANLSGRLWDPAKSKLVAATYAHWRYSCGLESKMAYEDWTILDKQNILSIGLEAIGEKPMKQLTHYFFTGEQLLDSGSRARSPIPTQYNYCLYNPGAGSGTLQAPEPVPITGADWTTVANCISNTNDLVNDYMAINPDAVMSQLYIFYPSTLRSVIFKKRATGGDGFVTAFTEWTEMGIPAANIIPLAPIYLPTGANGSLTAPLVSDFDIYLVDADKVKIWYTEAPATNTYMDKERSLHPEMVIETNVAALPVFSPIVGESTGGKYYKGVAILDGASQT